MGTVSDFVIDGGLALRASPGRAHVPREFWVKDGQGRDRDKEE
jgi:hypothetical protein